MNFERDEDKNQINIEKHGLDLADGEMLFHGRFPLLVAADTTQDYGEERWVGVGSINGRVVVVVFTERGSDRIRFISLRKADQEAKRRYEEMNNIQRADVTLLQWPVDDEITFRQAQVALLISLAADCSQFADVRCRYERCN